MPANDIEPLVVALLKKSLMDKSMINATADSILAATTSRGDGDVKSLQDEIVSIDAKIGNLMDALADGFRSDAVRQKLSDLEVRRKVLTEKIKALQNTTTLNRDELIAELTKDAEKISSDPQYMKEAIKKYITRIDVYNDRIEIHSLADFSTTLPDDTNKKSVQATISDDLNATGCGGRI